MRKTLKRIICFAVIFMMVFACVTSTVSAVSSSISLSQNNVTVGEKLVVTVVLNGGEAMYGINFKIKHNPDVLRFETSNTVNNGGSSGVIMASGTPTGLTKVSYVFNFTAIASGTSNIQIIDCVYSGVDLIDKGINGSSASVTVKDATKSGNADLKSLRLTAGTLSPAFSKDVTSYTATIPYSVTECKVYARTSDSSAQVGVEGSAEMKVGENTRTVVVTAPNGTQKRYKIVITRLAEGESVEGAENPAENSNKVQISGTNYEILSDLSEITVPKGFLIASAEYNGVNVATLEDENGKYLIYYLKNTEDNKIEPFILDENTKSFKKLPYITVGNDFYIVEEVDDTKGTPLGTQISSVNINGDFVSGFIPENDNMVGFYYITCYINGVSGFYRYDSEMGTLQRELGLVFGENTMSFDVEENSDNFFARFANLNTAAKFVVVGVALIAIIIIALVVTVILQAIKSRKRDNAFIEEQTESEVAEGFVFFPEDTSENCDTSVDDEQSEPEETMSEEAEEEIEEISEEEKTEEEAEAESQEDTQDDEIEE